jgi:hypothetical protein
MKNPLLSVLLALPCSVLAVSVTPARSARVVEETPDGRRVYELTSAAPLRDNRPEGGVMRFPEEPGHPVLRSGRVAFDALHALAVHEARLNSVESIRDGAYGNGEPLALPAFQTGEYWTYVWTRDLAYSVDLGLAAFDPARAVSSLRFKTSGPKRGVSGGFLLQVVQDTGSGGSYPISTDRVVWALGAARTLAWLDGPERAEFLRQAHAILRDTLEQDRRLVFDPADGLYRGEQSFLDWREQTYPGWTREDTLPVGLSKALSTNVLHLLALRTAADLAAELGQDDEAGRYAAWASALKAAIAAGFGDPATGLPATYLLAERGGAPVRPRRHDALGLALAVLADVTTADEARRLLSSYPVGRHGPPVVWPQDRDVPIYHNQAIWPFVTAYWLKAARHADHAPAAALALDSLVELAAANLSHMENFDWVTGRAHYQGPGIQGPVINSRRQLWSVAGYLGAMQDVVFGLETNRDGLRFRPYVPVRFRDRHLPGDAPLELRGVAFRGTRHDVRLLLPPGDTASGDGALVVAEVRLNGRPIGPGFVARADLAAQNTWEIRLGPPRAETTPTVRLVDVDDARLRYAPPPPEWDDAAGALTVRDGRIELRFRPLADPALRLTVFRDGQPVARDWAGAVWSDPTADPRRVHDYGAVAVDPATGHESHLTRLRRHAPEGAAQTIAAGTFSTRGGRLDGDRIVEWGAPGDTAETGAFTAARNGRHELALAYANGTGPINTGIACGVKRAEVVHVATGRVVAAGYLLMPQLATWERVEASSPLFADLVAGERYMVRLGEDEIARNMTYLAHNARYTSWPGGGDQPHNRVHLAGLRVTALE